MDGIMVRTLTHVAPNRHLGDLVKPFMNKCICDESQIWAEQ